MDDEKRQFYDDTGEIDDSTVNIDNTYNYYRDIYPQITKKDIDDFTLKYRESDLEKDDLINFYNENKGDLTNLLEFIPLSLNDDIDRFIDFYEDAIHNKQIKKTKKYTTTKNKIKILHEDDPEEVAKESEKFSDLCNEIIARKTQRINFVDNLKNKYAKGDSDKDEINEEEFLKAQKKITKKGK